MSAVFTGTAAGFVRKTAGIVWHSAVLPRTMEGLVGQTAGGVGMTAGVVRRTALAYFTLIFEFYIK